MIDQKVTGSPIMRVKTFKRYRKTTKPVRRMKVETIFLKVIYYETFTSIVFCTFMITLIFVVGVNLNLKKRDLKVLQFFMVQFKE